VSRFVRVGIPNYERLCVCMLSIHSFSPRECAKDISPYAFFRLCFFFRTRTSGQWRKVHFRPMADVHREFCSSIRPAAVACTVRSNLKVIWLLLSFGRIVFIHFKIGVRWSVLRRQIYVTSFQQFQEETMLLYVISSCKSLRVSMFSPTLH